MSHDNKVYHFVGIGGIGMSAIAMIMYKLGYKITGSDQNDGYMVQALRTLGIPVTITHNAELVNNVDTVVISSAIKKDNLEVQRAIQLGKPIIKRAEMLASLMAEFKGIAISGAHGKTTTTSLTAHVLEVAGWDPTVVSGGILNSLGTNAKLGKGEYCVVEADESDGSFTLFPKKVAIVTNIDHEHLDHYKTFKGLKASFAKFISTTSEDGFAIVCGDDDNLLEIVQSIESDKIFTYGFSASADVNITDCYNKREYTVFSCNYFGHPIQDIELKLLGKHNVLNATGVLAAAMRLGIPEDAIRKAFATFEGVRRRFSCVGLFNDVRIIDDYAHHPVEIRAILNAAKQVTKGKLIAVIQPHRYTRLNCLFREFCDVVKIPDYSVLIPLYSAGEAEIAGINSKALVDIVKNEGYNNVSYCDSLKSLAQVLYKIISPNDVIIMMGAGNITYWAQDLEKCLNDVKLNFSKNIK